MKPIHIFLLFAFLSTLLQSRIIPILSLSDVYSLEDAIIDMDSDSSGLHKVLYVLTKNKGIAALGSTFPITRLFQFTTSQTAYMVRCLKDNAHLAVFSRSQNQQLIEIFDVSQEPVVRTASSGLMDQRDIRQAIASNDSNYIYALDYSFGLSIIEIKQKNQINWIYEQKSAKNLTTHQMVMNRQETFVVFPIWDGSFQMAFIKDKHNISFLDPPLYPIGPPNPEYPLPLPTYFSISETNIFYMLYCSQDLGLNVFLSGLFSDSPPYDSDYQYATLKYCKESSFFIPIPNSPWGLYSYESTKIYSRAEIPITEDPRIALNDNSVNFHMLSDGYTIGQGIGELKLWKFEEFDDRDVTPQSITAIQSYKSGNWPYWSGVCSIFPTGAINENGNDVWFVGSQNLNNESFTGPGSFIEVNFESSLTGIPIVMDDSIRVIEPNTEMTLFASPDLLGRYFFTFVIGNDTSSSFGYYLNIYNSQFERFSPLAKSFDLLNRIFFQNYDENNGILNVWITQIDNILYLIPRSQEKTQLLSNIVAIDITDPRKCSKNLTNIETPLPGNDLTMITSCKEGTDKYLFYKFYTDPYLYIAKVSPSNFSHLETISFAFIKDVVVIMKTSDKCDYLYIGGNNFFMSYDISSKKAIKLVFNASVLKIQSINIYNNFIFLSTVTELVIFDIKDPLFPKFIDKRQKQPRGGFLTPLLSTLIYRSDYQYTNIFTGSTERDSESAENGRLFYVYQVKRTSAMIYIDLGYQPLRVNIKSFFRYEIYMSMSTCGLENCNESNLYLNSIKVDITDIEIMNQESLKFSSLPDWVEHNPNTQTISLQLSKDFLNKKVFLRFSFTLNVLITQIIAFPVVTSSLVISVSDEQKLQISTPSTSLLFLTITVDASKITILNDLFSRVFINYAKESGVFVANGDILALNSLLKSLRYTFSTSNHNTSFSITVNDQVNVDESLQNLNYSLLRRNSPPVINEPIQSQINKAKIASDFKIVPTLNFELQLNVSTAGDSDTMDKLDYTITTLNGTKLPSWFQFDPVLLKITGKPTIEDLGILALEFKVSDQYDWTSEIFFLNISDDPPEINDKIDRLEQQLSTNTVSVGVPFAFEFDSQTFLDFDGPALLTFSAETQLKNGTVLDLTKDFIWLKFFASKRLFSGTPNFSDTKLNDGIVNVTVTAFDGIKSISDSFELHVAPSLKFKTNSNGFPTIEYDLDGNINLTITSDSTKILLPLISRDPALALTQHFSKMNRISLEGPLNIINSAVKCLIIRETKNSSHRVVVNSSFDTGYDKDLTFVILDSRGQSSSIKVPPSNFINNSAVPRIQMEFYSSEYIAEIGSTFKMSIDKQVFWQENKNLQLNYLITVRDSSGIPTDWVSIQEQNLELYTLKPVSASLEGRYRVYITVIDEFNDFSSFQFTISVQYSQTEIILQWLRLIASILGPIVSSLTILKFYYFIFNFLYAKKYELSDELLVADRYFKRKYPIIREEYIIASQAFDRFWSESRKKLKGKPKLSIEPWNPDQMLSYMNELLKLVPKEQLENPEKQGTIGCLIEGLLIRKAIQEIPNAMKIFQEIQKNICQNRDKTFKKSNPNQWFSEFFISAHSVSKAMTKTEENPKKDIKMELSSEIKESELSEKKEIIFTEHHKFMKITGENQVKTAEKEEKLDEISRYVHQKGKYRKTEKHLTFNYPLLQRTFDSSINSLKLPVQKDIECLKKLMIMGIISYQRGIPYSPCAFLFTVNKVFSIIGLNILPFLYGQSIHTNVDEISEIYAQWTHKNDKKLLGMTVLKKNFFSLANGSIPAWIHVEQKNGILVVKGVPPGEEIGFEYLFQVINPKKKKILQFWLKVLEKTGELVELLGKSERVGQRMSFFEKKRANLFREYHHIKEGSRKPEQDVWNFNDEKTGAEGCFSPATAALKISEVKTLR